MGTPRQVWLLPVLLITVIATATGALVARSVYAEQVALPPPAVEPSPSVMPPSEQPGSSEVKGTADATTHPLYRTLQPLLQTYFNAINTKDYKSWAATVTAERLQKQPKEIWEKDYRSTRDGSIVIYRIEDSGGGARALLQFTSTQAIEDAPTEMQEKCIHWNVVWGFEKEHGDWRLAAGSTSATPHHTPCEKG